MNGAPANPMSGVAPSSATSCRTASVMYGTWSGVRSDELLEVAPLPDRACHDRADAGDDVEIDPDRLERNHDVAEEDGGVHPVPPHRLEGDLRDELGPHARLEHGDPLADGPVFRQGAAGLTHEPDRRPGHRLAAGGAHEVAVPGGARARREGGSGRVWVWHRSILPRVRGCPGQGPRRALRTKHSRRHTLDGCTRERCRGTTARTSRRCSRPSATSECALTCD